MRVELSSKQPTPESTPGARLGPGPTRVGWSTFTHLLSPHSGASYALLLPPLLPPPRGPPLASVLGCRTRASKGEREPRPSWSRGCPGRLRYQPPNILLHQDRRASLSSSSSRSALSRSLSSCSRRVLSAFSVSSSRVRSSAFSAARVSSLAVSSRSQCPKSAPTSSPSVVPRRFRGNLPLDCRLSRSASRLDTETKYLLSLPSPSSLASSSPSCIRLRHCRGLMPKAAAATLVVTHPWLPGSLPRLCPILQAG